MLFKNTSIISGSFPSGGIPGRRRRPRSQLPAHNRLPCIPVACSGIGRAEKPFEDIPGKEGDRKEREYSPSGTSQ